MQSLNRKTVAPFPTAAAFVAVVPTLGWQNAAALRHPAKTH